MSNESDDQKQLPQDPQADTPVGEAPGAETPDDVVAADDAADQPDVDDAAEESAQSSGLNIEPPFRPTVGADLPPVGEETEETADTAATSGPSEDDAPPIEPPAPPPPFEPQYDAPYAPIHHRLMRRPEGKVIAGVCSGLGTYTNTDPVLWRIGFVVFGLTSVGVLAYIVAWLVMPEARRGEPLPERPPHEAAQITRWAAIGAIILGCWVIFRGFFHFGGGWFWGLLLIGIGLAVWGRDLTGYSRPPRRPRPTTPPTMRATYIGGQAVQQTSTSQPSATSRFGDAPTPPANPATPSASAWPGGRPDSARDTAPTASTPTMRGAAKDVWQGMARNVSAHATPVPPTRPPIDWTRQPPRPAPRRREPSYLGRL
ncbi:MAG: PspC domain-containing protein, partial [Chloroflexi bacterium]|nr:PspC domain-containing protein [Chloroflexota bacterium]